MRLGFFHGSKHEARLIQVFAGNFDNKNILIPYCNFLVFCMSVRHSIMCICDMYLNIPALHFYLVRNVLSKLAFNI